MIEILDADQPPMARMGFERIALLFHDLPSTLRVFEGDTLRHLRCSLNCLSELCLSIDVQAEPCAGPL